ncbi:hypothetical protein CLV63_105168 [Murinocardiopsis flavida]|uniref:Molecular chaperone GrpE (Heat shock protein) n=1 Tax=Murinocardiopsis flavida TaxID=645275 RepID=A0A2P8DMQ5_9ACTN|nr:hypothetical protein [Murinocardiopsis flavida]PSK98494.1 hypothetical protein CLV63_105168 [Murinocardiopsis flavida]
MAGKSSRRSRVKPARQRTRRPQAQPDVEFTEEERPELPGPPVPPYAVVHKLLSAGARDKARAVNAVRQEARGEAEEQRRRYTDVASGVAAALHELRVLLARDGERLRGAGFADHADTLAALDRRIAATLANAGVRFIDPVGERYLAVADHLSVKHRPAEGEDTGLVVSETLSPGVLLDDGELLRPAQVFLAAGAPHTAEDAPAAEAGPAPPRTEPPEGGGAAPHGPETEENDT